MLRWKLLSLSGCEMSILHATFGGRGISGVGDNGGICVASLGETTGVEVSMRAAKGGCIPFRQTELRWIKCEGEAVEIE